MEQTKIPKDKTLWLMIGLFAIIGAFVAHSIWKGTHPGVVQMKEDVIYIKPAAKI